MTGRPKSTLNAFIRSGEIRVVRCGRAWLIPRESLKEWWVRMSLEGRKGQMIQRFFSTYFDTIKREASIYADLQTYKHTICANGLTRDCEGNKPER